MSHHDDGFMDFELANLAAADPEPDTASDAGPHWEDDDGPIVHSYRPRMKNPEEYTYGDFATAYKRSGNVNDFEAESIERPIPNPDISYDTIALTNREYEIRSQILSKKQKEDLLWLIPITIIFCFTIPTLIVAALMWLFWWRYAVRKTKEDIRFEVFCEEDRDPVSADHVQRMRRIECQNRGRILESDAAREVIFARQYCRRYLDHHIVDERGYKILMAPFEDEAKDILKRADRHPDWTMGRHILEMTTLFRYRLDPYLMSDESVKVYCEIMSSVFDDTGEHVDYKKLKYMSPYTEEVMARYRDRLLYGIDNFGNPM